MLTSAYPGLLSEPCDTFSIIFRQIICQCVGQCMTELFPTSSSDGREDSRHSSSKILEQSDANKDLETLFSD